jgi:3-oxoacyl-[acyl-carrier protein] reductase
MSAIAGQAAIVTGAAKGLGLVYATLLAEAGCRVLACDRDPAIVDVARELGRGGPRLEPLVADVSRPADAKRIVDRAVEAFGGVDILINNAGICRRTLATDGLEPSLADYEALIGTNLRGPFLLGRAVMPVMIDQNRGKMGGGNIVNIATDHVNTFPGRPTNGFGVMDLYDASKWGVIGLTLTWAQALKPHGVRVNAFCMDATESHMLRFFAGPDVADDAKARWMDPRKVCGLALELIAEGPRGRTGENFGVWCGFDIALTHSPRPLAELATAPS